METHEHKHTYKDTIAEAAGLDSSEENAERVKEREQAHDARMNYELLAVNSSMGVLGMDETTANLLQLEFAQELLYNFDENEWNENSDKR